MSTKEKLHRIGASELAVLVGANPYQIKPINWWKVYTRVFLRSFGYDAFSSSCQLTIIEDVADTSALLSRLAIDEKKVQEDASTLRASAQYQEYVQQLSQPPADPVREPTEAVATFYALVDEKSADPRAVGIVEEEAYVQAGKLVHNNQFGYGKDYSIVKPSDQSVKIIRLFSYIDGERKDGSVVEKKTRRNKLFSTIPEYEKVQLAVILYATGKQQIHLEQSYRGASSTHSFSWEQLEPFLEQCMQKLAVRLDLVSDLAASFRQELDEQEQAEITKWAASLKESYGH